MVKFEVGKTYKARFVTCHDLEVRFEVIKRTPKFVTLKEDDTNGTVRRCKVYDYDKDGECCYPYGQYSMCVVLRATREVE